MRRSLLIREEPVPLSEIVGSVESTEAGTWKLTFAMDNRKTMLSRLPHYNSLEQVITRHE